MELSKYAKSFSVKLLVCDTVEPPARSLFSEAGEPHVMLFRFRLIGNDAFGLMLMKPFSSAERLYNLFAC